MGIKKILISLASAFALVMGVFTLNVQAAPTTMADGNVFDPVYYAQNNPDVVSVFGNRTDMLYLHYCLFGKNEGRLPYASGSSTPSSSDGFDAAYYAAKYPDVVSVLGSDPNMLRFHYDNFGRNEGRYANAAQEAAAAGSSSQGSSSQGSSQQSTPQQTTASSGSSYEMQVLDLVNAERARYGLSPLSWDASNLAPGASVRAVEISTYFSHTRPDGSSCFTAVSNPGCLGENIAAGYGSPQAVMDGWMNSPGHRSNILDPDFHKLGVGYYYAPGTMYGSYWVQMFSS
ncbi:MAG: hypothetical protein K5871_02870 [Lachnospiraceae bacterium]|nr:hypothetical protein [Lachnospiraceae bacterium]